jgi:hypothetical protein
MSTDTRLKKLEGNAKDESHDDVQHKRMCDLYATIVRAINAGTEDDPALSAVFDELYAITPAFDDIADIKRIHLKIQAAY